MLCEVLRLSSPLAYAWNLRLVIFLEHDTTPIESTVSRGTDTIDEQLHRLAVEADSFVGLDTGDSPH